MSGGSVAPNGRPGIAEGVAGAITASLSGPFGTGWWRPSATHPAVHAVRIELRLAIQDRTRYLSQLELVGDSHDLDDLVVRFAANCPRGVVPLEACLAGPPTAVTGATYRIVFDAPGETLAQAVAADRAASELLIPRCSPMQHRAVDVRRYAPELQLDGDAAIVQIAIDDDGSAKPSEVVRALASCAPDAFAVAGITRRAVHAAPKPVRVGATETT